MNQKEWSIVKTILLLQALLDNDIETVSSKIGVEATGKPFDAILMTCGMYDGSGEFALRVGVPAKSGVGGGIMAVAPTKMGIGIYSPALDKKGNSVAGIHLLEKLSNQLYLSIF